MTASGAVVGMLALQAVYNDDIRSALIWLVVSQILDGLDGPIARKFDVVLNAPRIDGHSLDLIVDYVTNVVVPIAFMIHFLMFPSHLETVMAGSIFLFSALWFARTDLETDDHWFNGFPAAWNLVVPTVLLAHFSTTVVAVISAILCISQLTNFKVPHIVRSPQFRKITLPFGSIYLANLTYLSFAYSDSSSNELNVITGGILFGFPAYVFVISVWRTFFFKPSAA
jgi:phosphatidylcholine synthase